MSETNKLDVMIVGVGGQGTLLTSKILGCAAVRHGCDVKVSEVHGMSQRGGSVVTYVRMGGKVNSPVIEKGGADMILAFEQLEALRWTEYLKADGKIIINEQKTNPMPVISGKAKYPENIIETIKAKYHNTVSINALEIAKKCGSTKAVNLVMLGVLANSTGIRKELWLEAIRKNVPEKFLDVNLAAFEEGVRFTA